MEKFLASLKFDEKGLMPAVIQDYKSKAVLTLCYMNKDAIAKTFSTGRVYLYRRSKGRLMMKGQESGCIQKVKSLYIDCEGNSLLFEVEQMKAACHEGYFTCYYRKIGKEGKAKTVSKRIFDPDKVYPVRKFTETLNHD